MNDRAALQIPVKDSSIIESSKSKASAPVEGDCVCSRVALEHTDPPMASETRSEGMSCIGFSAFRFLFALTCAQETSKGFGLGTLPPIDVGKLPQKWLRFGVVDAYHNQPTSTIDRIHEAERLVLERGPVSAKRLLRHAQNKNRGTFKTLSEGTGELIPRPKSPFVVPNA